MKKKQTNIQNVLYTAPNTLFKVTWVFYRFFFVCVCAVCAIQIICKLVDSLKANGESLVRLRKDAVKHLTLQANNNSSNNNKKRRETDFGC